MSSRRATASGRPASEVIGRLEAVNAKLVEVEQAQPADVVDKKTVADIAAKQASDRAATRERRRRAGAGSSRW